MQKRTVENEYEPGIKAMIRSIFNREWALDPKLPKLQREMAMYLLQSRFG